MMRAVIFATMLSSMIWVEATMAQAAQVKCDGAAVTSYKDGVGLMTSTLDEPGPGRWWKGEPQISYDFMLVNYKGNLAVRVRPTSGAMAFLAGDGITLNAKICKVKTAGSEPPSVQLSIDTSQYLGAWSEVLLSKVKSTLHVNWDGKVALLKPTN